MHLRDESTSTIPMGPISTVGLLWEFPSFVEMENSVGIVLWK